MIPDTRDTLMGELWVYFVWYELYSVVAIAVFYVIMMELIAISGSLNIFPNIQIMPIQQQ